MIGRFTSIRSWAALFLMAVSAGCATQPPRYTQNWHMIQAGMTRDQVRDLLGESPLKVGPMQPEQQSASDLVGAVLVGWLLDLQYERWDYCQGEIENILEPSPKAYVVYFDQEGKVVKFRGPIPSTQPATPHGAYAYRDVSDTQRIGGDYLECLSDRHEGARSDRLKPPTPMNPPDRAIFSHFPREIILKWRPAPGMPADVEYLVQEDFTSNGNYENFGDWSQQPEPLFTYRTGKTTMNIRFMGAQPGRWRVKAMDKSGESEWCPWQYFRFTG